MSSSRYNQDKRVEEVEKLTAEHEEFVGELNASVSSIFILCEEINLFLRPLQSIWLEIMNTEHWPKFTVSYSCRKKAY